MDGPARALVIERHVAARDGSAEDGTRLSHTANGLTKLEVHLGPPRIAEVEVVGDRQWTSTRTRYVARGFTHGDLRADPRVEVDVAAVAVRLARQRAIRSSHAHHGGVSARPDHGVCADRRVVLAMDPRLRGDRRRREQTEQGP